jgi:16S rRNA processing protein RimM
VAATDRLEVGRIGRPHGLKGEVTVHLTSDRTERVAPGSVLHDGDRALVVETSRTHQGRWLVRFEGVHDRDGADALRGVVLTADPEATVGDELWVHELVGRSVRDAGGADLGIVRAVEANPASDLLVIAPASGGAEVLVPLTFLVSSDGDALVVDPPEGLLDLNG